MDRETLHSRDPALAGSGLEGAHIVMVGIGSLGSQVAAQLARAGVGRLTLIDPELLEDANVGRHVLGADELGRFKAQALCERLRCELPTLHVVPRAEYVQVALRKYPTDFDSADLVVVGGIGPLGQRGGVSRNGTIEDGWGSSHGARVDVAAPMGTGWSPGEDQVLSTDNAGTTVPGTPNYAFGYGTSMASPHVAGVAALVISASETELSPEEVKAIIKDSARAFPQQPDKPIGTGIVDASTAVDYAIEGPPPPCDPEVEECTPPATPIANRVPVTGLSGAAGSEALYAIEVPAGVTGLLNITTHGGSGDVSVYVSLDEEPQVEASDWRSTRPGNTETVRINNPAAGTYYIKLVGVRAYSNVTLQARHN